jgi:hypothetical protein
MFGPVCICCDKGTKRLSARDWCDACEALFTETMAKIRCAETSGICTSPFSCMSEKRCVQIRAAMKIVAAEEAKL